MYTRCVMFALLCAKPCLRSVVGERTPQNNELTRSTSGTLQTLTFSGFRSLGHQNREDDERDV